MREPSGNRMEKQDILVVAIAIIAFAVLALVVMPIINGQSIGLQTGGTTSGGGTGTLATPSTRATPVTTVTVPPRKGISTTPTPTPTPTVTPAWNGSVKNVGFIGQPGGQPTLPPTPPIPAEPARNTTLVTYAQISGRWSGTTQNLYIPTPYWVMEYTVVPFALPPDAFPLIIIQVIDVENPNRVVITPIRQIVYETPPSEPWSVKIFEGKRTYYFRIDTSFIKSYTITIKVPQEYL